jgi:hypothetical protein
MWSRFATVALLSMASCATVADGPAPPQARSKAQDERQVLGYMAGWKQQRPQPVMPSQGAAPTRTP